MKGIRAVIIAIVAALALLGGTTSANADSPRPAHSVTARTASADPVDPGFPPAN